MINLAALKQYPPCPLVGVYRFRDATIQETKHGQAYLRFKLEDFTGSISATIWQEDKFRSLDLMDYSVAKVTGHGDIYNNQMVLNISEMRPFYGMEPTEACRLIPASICPEPCLLNDLHQAVEMLTIPALKQFTCSVLTTDSIAFPFVSLPASCRYHHDTPAGLLQHSLECFHMVSRFTEFPREDYELGLVAMLFHDIGKVLTLNPDRTLTSLGSSVEHDKLTFEILAPALKQLSHNWPYGAEALRYILDWKQSKQIPRHDMADVVTCCDRASTGLNRRQKAIEPHHHNAPTTFRQEHCRNATGSTKNETGIWH